MADIPQPPTQRGPDDLYRAIKDIITFLRDRNESGLKFQSYTQTEIDQFTDFSYEGTIVYNSTTREANVAFVSGSNLLWRSF